MLVRLLGIRNANDNDVDDARLADELIPCRPDDDSFESRLKAVLRRHVVERCIYAVDLDPLAVELCRLSLWIETMDRTLPFGFLDHKVKCGNALIGAWFDQFAHYPVMAWKNREGGDKNHANGVHFEQNARTKTIKAFVKDKLRPDLERFLGGADLFSADLLEQAAEAHYDALSVLKHMHAMPVHDAAERARLYRDQFVRSTAWKSLKEALDLWCACWFWPVDHIDHAPLPSTFADPPDETRAVGRRVAADMRFFHWELEFPDVFREAASGFDAMLGNPPWDIAKPVSQEFFSNLDPLYRSYGKQEALDKQSDYFADAEVERNWLDYGARFRAQSNFMSHAASPFGDPDENPASQDRFTIARGGKGLALHERWRDARTQSAGFADAAHPFRHQGSADLNLYKLFLETTHALLTQPRPGASRPNAREASDEDDTRVESTSDERQADPDARGGRLGFLVPSGLYSDHGTGALRDLFLEHCRWEWLFGVENRDRVFPIHRSYKFNPVVIEKGGATEVIRTVFMRRNPDDWERAEDLATPYTRAQVERFSPKSRALLEFESQRDLEILEKIYANAVLLGDDSPDGWGIRYAREFDMTNDSQLFPPRPQWEAKGYRPDEYSRWLLGAWRPIGELWEEMEIDPSRPEPAAIELESWLFDTTAGPERREAEARFVHGHRLKPGDVVRTARRARCAPPPYDGLPVPRTALPPGVILSRNGDTWVRDEEVRDVALPLYQGIMIQPFLPSARGWLSGTGLRAKWDYCDLGNLQWNPQYLMAEEHADPGHEGPSRLKIGYRRVARSTDARSFIGAVLPSFPCGDAVFTLHLDRQPMDDVAQVLAMLNSFVFDYVLRQSLGGTNLSWYLLAECPLPRRRNPFRASGRALSLIAQIVRALNLSSNLFSTVTTTRREHALAALRPGERLRQRATVDALAFAAFGLNDADVTHIFRDIDRPTSEVGKDSSIAASFDPRGFWRLDRDKDPELRQTVLTLVAFRDLQEKIDAAGGNRERGIKEFLAQNDGEGWMLPETLRLADYGLGHDERAREPQPVASRLGPRFCDWQLVQSADESRRECHLHARHLLGEHGYALRVVDLIAQRMADGEGYRGPLTDSLTRDLAGDDGYVTVLTEIRARDLLYESAWWSLVGELRGADHLSDDSFGRLLERLHARDLLSDADYRRRGGRAPLPATGADLPVQRVAETGPGGLPELFPTRRQRKLFE